MKKSKLQKKKDNVRSMYWKRKADEAWGRVATLLYDECAVGEYDINDPCAGNLERHHLISRGRIGTRHDPQIAIMLCSKHHKYSTVCSPHGGPVGFVEWLQKHRPTQYQYVIDHKNDIAGMVDYKERAEKLNEIAESIERLGKEKILGLLFDTQTPKEIIYEEEGQDGTGDNGETDDSGD